MPRELKNDEYARSLKSDVFFLEKGFQLEYTKIFFKGNPFENRKQDKDIWFRIMDIVYGLIDKFEWRKDNWLEDPFPEIPVIVRHDTTWKLLGDNYQEILQRILGKDFVRLFF